MAFISWKEVIMATGAGLQVLSDVPSWSLVNVCCKSFDVVGAICSDTPEAVCSGGTTGGSSESMAETEAAGSFGILKEIR